MTAASENVEAAIRRARTLFDSVSTAPGDCYSLFGVASAKNCVSQEFWEYRRGLAGSLGALLLLLLLHPLYLGPHQVAGLALQLDRIALLRVVEFQQVLHFPDAAQGLSQLLRGALLLLLLALSLLLTLLLLLLSLLLLVPLRHRDLLDYALCCKYPMAA